ncbi:putative cytoplasmic protein [Escherichia coli]|nr:putative cytoplasmic protein [Escherichia coli]
MQSLDPLFARLSRSKFRSRFRLGMKERQYCLEKGAPVIEQHAADFVAKRLAPALPANDGKQTPMRGHPVFIAQHATATCCRGCLAKWHNIPQGCFVKRRTTTLYRGGNLSLAGCTDESAMRIAENDKIAFPGYLYLPPLLANMLSFMRIYLLR